jgi:hypothetical protein
VSSPEKIDLYADLLAGAISIDAPDDVDVESFVSTLQLLTPREIGLARDVFDRWERNEDGSARMRGVNIYAGQDSEYFFSRLEGAGLVVPVQRTGPIGAGVRVEGYEPSPTLARLMGLLRSGRAGL